MADQDSGSEEYFVPLQDQRVFGAGIKRKRVQFVPAKEASSATTPPRTDATSTGEPNRAGDYYLSVVLASGQKPPIDESKEDADIPRRCEVCDLPFPPSDAAADNAAMPTSETRHAASLAHQVCLTHSAPPSHLDRQRLGLQYLSSYGWDPDTRLGLGASGREGITAPIKGRLKRDTLGVGVKVPEGKRGMVRAAGKIKVEKLGAGEVRKREAEARRKGERLREMFYGRDEVLRYLGNDI
ncbi:MAG: hypothetical protein M1832_005510 [Thelocarpon impressellum]|nr:MAG: hypothetical protein M1832_005510 [Thelocarpon impressellum]